MGGTPYIPFTSRNVEPKDDSIWAKMYHLFMYRREEFMEHYHKRSSVESAFSMLKAKFGSSVRSKSDWGQVNDVLCKVIAHNICVVIRATHELGIEPAFGSKRTFGGVAPKIACEPKLQSLHQNYKALLRSRMSARKVCYDTTVTGAAPLPVKSAAPAFTGRGLLAHTNPGPRWFLQ